MTGPHPLVWPEGWPRRAPNDRPRTSAIASEHVARNAIISALMLMQVDLFTVMISTNASADAMEDDPGAAVYWTASDGQASVLACDTWSTVAGNLWTIYDALTPLVELWRLGVPQISGRALSGFALPANTNEASRELAQGRTT